MERVPFGISRNDFDGALDGGHGPVRIDQTEGRRLTDQGVAWAPARPACAARVAAISYARADSDMDPRA
jgi:hypothetical protein